MPPAAALPDTPVMRQYRALKAKHPGTILFFRLGDFYEMFAGDAEAAAPALGLVLTSRQGIAMCGVPVHSYQGYVSRLLKAGHKVAIADQMEAASKEKKLVERAITRLITPGTVIEDELLEPSATNFLVALEVDLVGWGAACIDVSTGEFWASQGLNDQGFRRLLSLLARIGPAEVLAEPDAAERLRLREVLGARTCLTLAVPKPPAGADPSWARESIWLNHHLAARAALRARRYVAETQFHIKEILSPTYRESASELQLDETAIRTLELVEAASGDRKHCLWGLLDHCRTPMGSRRLKSWILHPSTDVGEIVHRQNSVEELFNLSDLRNSLGKILAQISDIARVTNRLATRQAGPRDLGALRDSLAKKKSLMSLLKGAQFCSGLQELAGRLDEAFETLEPCARLLDGALQPQLPARLSDGSVFQEGHDPKLDELRSLKTDGHGHLAKLEAAERKETGIGSLKAGYNSIFGYYLEITKVHQAKVPARYTRKQTLTNAERYITPELKELENAILGAEDKILRLEARLFESLREKTLENHSPLMALAQLLSELDVLCALASAASIHDFVKPTVDLSHDLEIVEGRHPVVAPLLPSGQFVPNSLTLNSDDPRVIVLTGPNMSGKSTFLRQNALIALMAQIGSFVPARSAKVGIVDRILTRIGAQDALSEGQSTFMVEMTETAHILRSASARSLLILDEVGRGTSTFDGISIAWAVLEHLHSAYFAGESSQGPRVLFATHYFELTALAAGLAGVANFNVEAKEWTNGDGRTEVVFLHKISPGPADRSYGIQVAALAGLPAGVLARAREILARLEEESASGRLSGADRAPDAELTLPMFEEHPVLHALRLLDCERMTPLEGLSALAELKKKL